jgi:3-phenylpropionate/trans-cinnamate dioxygenase ferredoxin subunit
MNDFVALTKVGDMAPGSMKLASLGGREYLVSRAGAEYFITNSRCPHMGGRLEKGTLEGTILTCPLHNSQFDLRDGRVMRWTRWHGVTLSVVKAVRAPRPLRSYASRVEGDTLLIGPEKTPPAAA